MEYTQASSRVCSSVDKVCTVGSGCTKAYKLCSGVY